MNNNQLLNSPVNTNSFIWMAAYHDNTFLSEFNYDSQTENSFYDIEKDKLIRFGLVGYGLNLYYEVFSGVFKIAGQMVEVIYKENDIEYALTGQQIMYNDIIQFKNAEAALDPLGRNIMGSQITQYNFGYKQNMNINDVNFNFKAICSVPYGRPAYLNLTLVADRDMNGYLIIRKNSLATYDYYAPLEANVGYELNWDVVL